MLLLFSYVFFFFFFFFSTFIFCHHITPLSVAYLSDFSTIVSYPSFGVLTFNFYLSFFLRYTFNHSSTLQACTITPTSKTDAHIKSKHILVSKSKLISLQLSKMPYSQFYPNLKSLYLNSNHTPTVKHKTNSSSKVSNLCPKFPTHETNTSLP